MAQQTLAGPVPGPPTAPAHRARARAAAAAYLVLAAVGLVGTWAYNLQHTGDGSDYLGAWFATPASSSAAVDVLVTAVVACLFYLREGARLGWRWSVALVPLTFAVALAFTLPLFLALRELRGSRAAAAAGTVPGGGALGRA